MEQNNNFSEEYSEKWKSYLYSGTDVLINKYNITDYNKLKEKNKEISFIKLVELYENPIKGNFDAEH